MAAWPTQSSYVLFSSEFARDFYCAVPTSSEIPHFLVSPAWRYVAILRLKRFRRARFDENEAQAAIHHQGYYLFARSRTRNETKHSPKPRKSVYGER
jgi:hypothetical protein